MGKTVLEKKTLTREQLQELARVARDPFAFSKYIRVVHPVRGTVPFDLYPYQESCLYQFLKHRFNIILKFRQGGLTELISMFCLWLAMYHDHKKINIISIKDTTAKKVLKKIKFMYKNLPWYLQTPIVNGRMGDFGSVNSMEFSNGSLIESLPTSENAGRSESLSLLVIDEAAAVRWAGQVWASSLPTLSCCIGSTPIFIREYTQGDKHSNSLPSTKISPIQDICPPEKGISNISSKRYYTLTHRGEWKLITHSQNKGELETWYIKDCKGNIGGFTPAHRLFTTKGWKTVKEILEEDLNIISIDTNSSKLKSLEPCKKPHKEILKGIAGFPDFYISNFGKVYHQYPDGVLREFPLRKNKGGYLRAYLTKEGIKRDRGSISNQKKSKVFPRSIHSLVYTHFVGALQEGYQIDHIDNIKTNNYPENLRLVTPSDNVKKTYEGHNLNALLDQVSGDKLPDILKRGRILELYQDGFSFREISQEIYPECKQGHKFVKRILTERGSPRVYISKISLVKKTKEPIYDICVEDHHSYVSANNFVNHNTGGSAILNSTPLGTGSFYHKTWVDAVQGINGINPIRLYWQMHPERNQAWYDTMLKALGPKRTAQEIDGDFLSSGNTVFDMSDIIAIEQCLSDWTTIKTLLKGQYRQFNEVDPNKEYFIGADCATGRGTDYSAFSVMDRSGEDQACFKGKIPLNKYARLLGDIGETFNFAKLAPETNDIGAAVTMQLQDDGYPNLYQYQKLIRKKGKTKPDIEEIPGWLTTSKNRSVIIEGLEKDLREDEVVIKDPFFTNEAHTFIYDGSGRPVAMGKHRIKSGDDLEFDDETYSDDAIFGKAITNHIRKQYGNTAVVLPE